MARDIDGVRRNAVPLRDDVMGVALEDSVRTIQERNDENGYYVSLKLDWLNQLQLADKGAATLHSMSMQPVIVQNPAIIIQPEGVINGDSE